MPRLHNPTRGDLFAPQIHRQVPALDSIALTDAEAEAVAGNAILILIPDEHAVAPVRPVAPAPVSDEVRSGTRRKVTRGGERAEITEAPVMETRG